MSDFKLSKELEQLHESGDAGQMVEGFSERAQELENTVGQQQREIESLWETHINVANELGVDTEKARNTEGKPSAVYLSYIQKLQQERDALAAHVERISEILRLANNTGWDIEESLEAVINIIYQSPSTSLAEVRAKAVEDAILSVGTQSLNLTGNRYCDVDCLREHANNIRNGKYGE